MNHPRHEFWQGVKATIPLIVGAIPFGILFGTLAPGAGLSSGAALAMSAIVFAGSAQFIALGLLTAGAGVGVIIATTAVVNLRHLLYSAAMVNRVKHLSGPWRALLAFGLTDESFAAISTRYDGTRDIATAHWFYLGSIVSMWGNWLACTAIGLTLGNLFPGITHWGLDFAMSVTFIGMVVPYLKNRAMYAAVLVAGVMALLCYDLPHKLGLMVAALIGISVGIIMQHYDSKPSRTAGKPAAEKSNEEDSSCSQA
jgi:4-azaleucine resistance transporter AzlC